MTPDRVAAVLIDLDGVLVDTESPALEVLSSFLKKRGKPIPMDMLKRICGRPKSALRTFFRLWLEVSDEAAGQYASRYQAALERTFSRHRTKPFPGAAELLSYLASAQVPYAVVTSSARALATRKLSDSGLLKHVNTLICEEDVDHGKPLPDPYIKAAKALNVKASQCLVVEDSLVGIEAARAAGMVVLAISQTHPASQLIDADMVAITLGDVRTLLAARYF